MILSNKTIDPCRNPVLVVILTLIGAALFCYTIARASQLSFTHDESLSFNTYINSSFNDVIAMKYPLANNHILNTLLMQLCYRWFGGTELSLRAPNLLAHIIFMVFSALWLWQFRKGFIIISGFILLNGNPFLLEFFSLARGYGLALAFMMGSLYFLSRYMVKPIKFNIWYSLLLGMLAVASNIALLHYQIALYFTFNIYFLTQIKTIKLKWPFAFRQWLKMNIPVVISIILMFAFLYEPVRLLTKHQQLYFGGIVGFWYDTVSSLICSFLYSPAQDAAYFVMLRSIQFFYISGILLLVFSIFNKYFRFHRGSAFYFFILVLVTSWSTIIQHALMGSNFLITRTALFFMPLFLVYVISLLYFLATLNSGKFRIAAFSLMSLFSCAFIYNAFLHINLGTVQEWYYDAKNKEAMTDLEKDVAIHHENAASVTMGITWLLEPSLNYYKTVRKYTWLNKLTRDGIKGNYDYYYLWTGGGDKLVAIDSSINLRLVAKYTMSNCILYANAGNKKLSTPASH